MPRTDENGKGLQARLGYVLDRAVSSTDIYRALGIARNTYATRSLQDDFPNAEELRLVGDYFRLNPIALMVAFGLLDPVQVEEYLLDNPLSPAGRRRPNRPLALTTSATTSHRRVTRSSKNIKIAELPRRPDHPGV